MNRKTGIPFNSKVILLLGPKILERLDEQKFELLELKRKAKRKIEKLESMILQIDKEYESKDSERLELNLFLLNNQY